MGAFDGRASTHSHRLISAAGTANATNIVARRAVLKRIIGHNANAAARYLKIYDKATAPASTDTPIFTFYLPASASFALDFDAGHEVVNGLGYRLVTGNGDSDDTAVTAGDILGLNIAYAL